MNKKTGEIEDWGLGPYKTLAELNEEWEDYEEPTGIQCIYYTNHFGKAKINGVFIGYQTKEEAKKAVEKLKAWKRLKDNGFRFTGYKDNTNPKGSSYQITIEAIFDGASFDDLDLLFGGEE